MAGTPIRMLNNCRLVDYLLIHEDDAEAITELKERLLKKTTVGRAGRLIARLVNAIRGLNQYDTDNIKQNRKCKKFGRMYWEIRNKIIDLLTTEYQLRIFPG